MEQSVEVEENRQKSDSLPPTKSSSSLIRIDAITIDLSGAMDNHQDASQCEHFSIREYVAGMREKDISICLPFAIDDMNVSDAQTSILPPLNVVKFKWWSCHNCLREIGAACCEQEIGKVPDSSPTGSLSKGSCSIKERFNDAAKAARAVACTESNMDKITISSRGYDAEKNNNTGQSIAIGSENDAYHQMFPATKDIINSKQALITVRHGDNSDATGRNPFGNMESCGPSFRGHISSNIGHLESNGSSSAEVGRTGTSNTPNGKQRMEIGDCDTISKVGNVSIGDINVTKGKTSISRLLDDLSSESSDRFAKNVHHDKFEDSSNKPGPQRTPKVRLLTELLGSGENTGNDQSRTTDSDFDSASDFCDDITAQRFPKQQSKGKRKITQDENGKPPSLPKKSKLSKGDAHLAKRHCIVVNSETEESSGTFVQQRNLNTKNHVLSKKKHKQTQYEGGYPSLVPHQEVAKKYPVTATEGGVSRPAHCMYSDNEMDPHYKGSISPLQAEPKSNMNKKKNKQIGISQPVPVPQWSTLPGEGSSARKDSDACGKKGVDLSLNRYVVACRNEESHIAKTTIGDEPLLLPWNSSVREGCHAGESSIIHKSAPDQHSGKGLLCDLNKKIATQSPIIDVQNAIPRFGQGSIQHHRELNISGNSNSEPKNDDQDKGNEDIPMEIVELLAKHQYDRRQHEFERNYFSPEQTNEKRKFESMGSPRVHGNGFFKSFQVEDHSARKSLSPGTFKSSEHLAPMKVNPVTSLDSNESRLSMSKMEGRKSAFARCGSHFNSQGNQSGRLSYPDPGSIRNGHYQNFQWNGDHVGTSFSSPKVRYPVVPNFSQNYAAQASNFGTNSQVPEVSSKGNNSAKCLDLNIGNEQFSNFEKQNRNIGFESFQNSSNPFASKHKGFDLNANVSGSLDLHSNEAIPAMQLLSLMDAGMKSSPLFNSEGNHKMILKPFSPCDYHPMVLDKPMFFSDHLPKESFGRPFGVSSNGSRPSSSNSYGKNQWRDYSCECPPPIPAFGPFASAIPNGSTFKGTKPTRVPPKSEEKKKRPAQNTRKLQKPECRTGISNNTHDSNSIHSIQRGPQHMSRNVSPLQSIPGCEFCSVNKNPADFSTPEPGNLYMIDGGDLKFEKEISRGKKGSANADGKKKQRITVLAVTKPQ